MLILEQILIGRTIDNGEFISFVDEYALKSIDIKEEILDYERLDRQGLTMYCK